MKDTSIISAIVSGVNSFCVSLDVEVLNSLWILRGGDGAEDIVCLVLLVDLTSGVSLVGKKAFVVEMARNVYRARASCFARTTMIESDP